MRRITVFVRDGNLRRDLIRALRNAGYGADEVVDRSDIARIAAEAGDAILVDVGGRSDLRTIAALHRTSSALSIIALASDASPQQIVEAKREGACELLRMPFDVASLERVLTRSLRHQGSEQRDVALIARDSVMARLLEEARGAAATEATLRIVGASGTGKSLLAEWIHYQSPRADGPLVFVNCAGLSEELAEIELFGNPGNRVTRAKRGGRIHAAAGGTLILEDISELSLSLQPRLLRVLQEREIVRSGSSHAEPIDLRIVATTQRDLEREVSEGRFREDLYYRIDVLELRIPLLRDRPADIEPLANALLSRFARQHGTARAHLSRAALDSLRRHAFPGNVRELANLMRRAAILFADREVSIDVLLTPGSQGLAPNIELSTLNLRNVERETILRSLDATGGNRTRAAAILGISVRTLRNKLQIYAGNQRDTTNSAHSAGVLPS